jgi:hypothetical protein
MKAVVCSALGNQKLIACLESLLQTTDNATFDIEVVRERETREATLNEALKSNHGQDLFLIGDDITFTR